MGYTHYTNSMERELTKEEVGVINKIIKTSGVKIVGGSGEAGTKPLVVSGGVNLNGVGDDSHESFNLEFGAEGDFCKTARKPYDVVVVAILTYLAAQGVLTWSSDGDKEDHIAGGELLNKVLGV